MNGLLDTQTSSNNWGPHVQSMLHERVQADTQKSAIWSYDHSMFKDMERRILLVEPEFKDTLDILKRTFILSNVEAVEDFLKTHRGVASVLLEAAPYRAKACGEETPLALEIMPGDGLISSASG